MPACPSTAIEAIKNTISGQSKPDFGEAALIVAHWHTRENNTL